jgi:hypothetical protein
MDGKRYAVIPRRRFLDSGLGSLGGAFLAMGLSILKCNLY